MLDFFCTPTLRCPFCGTESLVLFRSKLRLSFDIEDESAKKDGPPLTALLCGKDHFFFIRRGDVRIEASVAPDRRNIA